MFSGNLKLGCARFARNGEKVFKLTDIKNKEDYEKIRSSMTLRIEGADFNSGTHTGDGIKKALEEFKNHGNDVGLYIIYGVVCFQHILKVWVITVNN